MLVLDLLGEQEAQAVLSVPLSLEESSDNGFWRLEKSGVYTVKSAYRKLVEDEESVDLNENYGFWKLLWRVHVPPKVKNFLWRACTNCLPSKVQLRTKHVEVSSLCPLCNIDHESILHCLVFCSFASAVWAVSGLGCSEFEGGSFAEWLRLMFNNRDGDQRSAVAMLCWAIWNSRNELVWNQRGCEILDVVVLANSELNQWRNAEDTEALVSLVVPEIGDGAELWCKPLNDMIKVNVEAAIFPESGNFNFGCVARDSFGVLREAFASCRGGLVSPGVAEAIGVREALSWIKRSGWVAVTIETDYLLVVQTVRSSVVMPSYFGGVIEDCRLLLQEMRHVRLKFVKRSANRVAYNLARASSIISDRVFGVGCVPSEIQSALLDDLLN